MASSSRSGDSRPIHQDFIARIRYSNALPPPPNPPKLLDIPNTGLASGQYTAPGFASRLAREQPLNIEADAELGMPLDLVGMPGIFDGDESSIQAPAQAPQPHPHDKPLLRSLQQLGKPRTDNAAVSFLRRTEYISSAASKSHGASPLRALNTAPARRQLKRKTSPEPDKDSPAYVKRKIDQSFSITEQNLKDRSRVRHPTKRNLKLVEAYPFLPDLEAFPDSGAYVTIKFLTNPVGKSTKYDSRLLNGVFKPIERSEAEEAAIQAAREAYERDPQNNPKPADSMHYDFYLNDTEASGKKFRQRFDVDNPDRDDDSLYPHKHDSDGYFQFNRLRAYETAHESELDHRSKYDEELIIAFNDEDTSVHQKAAYYYPVMQRSQIRPQRTKNIQRKIGIADEDEQIIDQLDVTVDEPTDEIKEQSERFKRDPYCLEGEEEEEDAAAEDVHHNGHANGAEETNGRSSPRSAPAHSDEELDAEGDEED